jgi:lipopolysaccharide/colanic/teichoic acid biosynthesis glycosyltransferase
MASTTLKFKPPSEEVDNIKSYVHAFSTTSVVEKRLLLLGSFTKAEQELLFEAGYYIYPVLFTDKSVTPENLKCLPLKEISAIIVKKDDSKVFYKGIEVIKQLKLDQSFPVIMFAAGMPSADELKKLQIIDEVILSLDNKDSLDFKIDFLAKYKKMSSVRFTLPDKLNSYKNSLNNSIRRSFDILIALVLLILLSPLMLMIALIIKLESKGSVFYISKRAGKHYKIFPCIKYRTMISDADSKLKDLAHLNQYSISSKSVKFVKIKDDPRVTRFGSFLRNTSLDELPQLINVFFGDMSLVGNRPLPLYEAATLTNDMYSNRFNAPAGITGLWQILKRGEDEMSTEERIELDIKYAKNNSLFVDLWILVRTPFAMFQKTNV